MRPLILALALALAVPAIALPASATATGPGHGSEHGPQRVQDLRDLARKLRINIGSAVDVAVLRAEPDYKARLNREFDHLTAENAMKWESVEPERGVYTWQDADEVVRNARRNGQQVRGHTLVWHNQLPAWLTTGVENGTIGATELRQILRDHITTQVRRYKGQVRAWDVVNEAFERGRHAPADHLADAPRPRLHRRRLPLGAPGRPARQALPERLQRGVERPPRSTPPSP